MNQRRPRWLALELTLSQSIPLETGTIRRVMHDLSQRPPRHDTGHVVYMIRISASGLRPSEHDGGAPPSKHRPGRDRILLPPFLPRGSVALGP